jgi:predicted kinase
VREIHGDLRLEHLYDTCGFGRVEDLRIIDCVEFSDALRHGDPAADIAFLAMDLRMHGAWSLADELSREWTSALEDTDAAELLPLYSAYRSAVRAKVRMLQARDPALDEAARDDARALAMGHLVLALGELVPPDDRPALVLVGGLPGTGKSRLAADLQERADMTWIRADAVRKELAGLSADASGKSAIEGGIYTHEWNDRTYGECLARARAILEEGGRVIVDASFKEERRREELIAVARGCGARVHILICAAPPDAVRTRLAERRDDPSDADWTIYEHAVRTWQPLGVASAAVTSTIDTERPHEETVAAALNCLRSCGIVGVPRASIARATPW